MKQFYAAALFLPFLAACAGGGGSVTSSASRGQAETPLSNRGVTGVQSDAMTLRQTASVPASNDLLYVSNYGNNSITIYHHDAQGNTAPIATIAGSKTKLVGPSQLSEDATGNLYVANGATSGATPRIPSILVFAHGANGNVAPIRIISGPLTGLRSVEAVTVDQTSGKIYVVDSNAFHPGQTGLSELVRFPPNANGNIAPFARSESDSVYVASEIASDSTGNDVIVAGSTYDSLDGPNFGAELYAKQFSNGANPSLPYYVGYFYVFGVADDPTTKTYLVSGGPNDQGGKYPTGIYRFAEETVGHGYVYPNNDPPVYSPAVISIVTSAAGCGQLALGYLRNIYAVCGSAINVYAHDASGNVAPIRVLSGPSTKLNAPTGIYEGK